MKVGILLLSVFLVLAGLRGLLGLGDNHALNTLINILALLTGVLILWSVPALWKERAPGAW